MSDRLPEQIETLRMVSQGERLKGTIALGKMQRLRSLLTKTDGDVSVELEFGRDQAGLAHVIGRIKAVVSLICQRCMQSMDLPIDAKVSLGIVLSQDQAEKLPDRYEPLVVEDGYSSLTELVEDELLLALPVAPVHAVEQCPAGDRFGTKEAMPKHGVRNNSEGSRTTQASERPNPFAVLADLKAGLKKK